MTIKLDAKIKVQQHLNLCNVLKIQNLIIFVL